MNCLAYAVARHETGSCTLGVGRTHNNCFGIRLNSKWVGYKEDKNSFAHFKDIWTRLYGGRIPTFKDAQRYSGRDRANAWYTNVLYFYNQCTR